MMSIFVVTSVALSVVGTISNAPLITTAAMANLTTSNPLIVCIVSRGSEGASNTSEVYLDPKRAAHAFRD